MNAPSFNSRRVSPPRGVDQCLVRRKNPVQIVFLGPVIYSEWAPAIVIATQGGYILTSWLGAGGGGGPKASRNLCLTIINFDCRGYTGLKPVLPGLEPSARLCFPLLIRPPFFKQACRPEKLFTFWPAFVARILTPRSRKSGYGLLLGCRSGL